MLQLQTPPLGSDTITAREYQDIALDLLMRCAARQTRAALVIHPTGSGKTILIAKIARRAAEKGNRVLVVSHREEIGSGIANTLDRVGLTVGIEKSNQYGRIPYAFPHAVVASIQTLKGERLESWPDDYFQIVIVDEAHHSIAPSYLKVINRFKRKANKSEGSPYIPAFVVGVTATPDRADKQCLMSVYGEVADELRIRDLVLSPDRGGKKGGPYLARPIINLRDMGISLKQLKYNKRRDFTDADLAERIRTHIERLANSIRMEVGDRPTIVFMPDTKTTQAMASALEWCTGSPADWITHDDPDRTFKVDRYKNQESQFLVNYNILTEGADFPHTSAVALCRPTTSRALLSQMIGRGLRPGKPDCMVLDFGFITDHHDALARPQDLFDDIGDSTRVRERVEELIREGGGKNLDILDLVEKAEAQIASEPPPIRPIEIKAKKRDVDYKFSLTYDPIEGGKAAGKVEVKEAKFRPPTPAMVAWLKSRGKTDADQWSFKRAFATIDGMKKWEEKRRAEWQQTAF